MTTEVAASPLEGHKVQSVRHYEAGPPANISLDVVDPENTYATTKEEEWVTKKKTELTTTRQIETRVKRQVVLEDGKVVDDSGPIVTTNTTEDTETQEHKQTEHRTTGDEPPGPDWVAIPGPGGLVKEVKERKVKSREEKEERIETEDVQHLGDITDEGYQRAVQNQQNLREVLLTASDSKEVVSSSPKVVHQSSKTHKVVDTEDSQELSQLQEDGRLVTETRRTTEHEEVRDQEEPDEEKGGHSEEEETKRESSHRFAKTKDQDLVEYIANGVKIGEEMRYVAENIEGERHGDPADMGDHHDWDSLSTRIRRMRRQGVKARGGVPPTGGVLGAGPVPIDRKDALTKKPLDFDQEEETRKVETSKWLEHHFGSDSRSSKGSIDDDDLPSAQPTGGSTSYINVTMKSRPITSNRAVTTRVVTPINGHASASSPTYMATVNSSSRVFVSSPEPEVRPNSPPSGFFQGVSEWSERRNDVKETKTFSPQRPDRIQVLPSGPSHTFGRTNGPSPHTSNNRLDRISPQENVGRFSPPQHYNSTAAYESNNFLTVERNASSHYRQSNGRHSPYQQRTSDRSSPYQTYSHQVVTRESSSGGFQSRPSARAASPYHHKSSSRTDYAYNENTTSPTHGDDDYLHEREQSPQPPYRRRHHTRDEEDRYEKRSHEQSRGTEPSPDYSPPPVRTTPSPSPSPSPPPEPTPTNKKLYQRTRFAADIPPPPARPQPRAKSPGQSIIRRLVDKFRSSSSERKNKRRSKRASRSPSPRQSSTYQQYHVIDNNIPTVGRQSPEPVAPPRPSRTHKESTMHRRTNSPVVQRFYLGEDPFGGSIYGREREYDGVTPVKSSRRHHRSNGHRHPGEEEDLNRGSMNSSTLGRLSKSTSRLISGGTYSPGGDPGRGAQTLPRKLHNERVKNQVYVHQSTEPQRWESNRHSNSMINVSIINNVTPPTSSIGVSKPLSNGVSLSTGPAKPARTYRSNLARSKSFNVHAGGSEPSSLLLGSVSRDTSNVYKSNPHLHRLDESPPPLKSPGILASISRSQRDLSETSKYDKDDSDPGRSHESSRFSKSTSNLISNGYGLNRNSNSTQEVKKKLFMKDLMDRAPELYKTLHGDEIPDVKSSSRGRLYSSTPLKNGVSSNISSSRVLDYSNSFRSSSTNATPERDSYRGNRPSSSPYRPSMMVNGVDRVTSPVGKPSYTSTLTHTPSFRGGDSRNGTTTSIMRRGSLGKDDYSETVRITSKSDDPIRPSVTNTVQSFSKKTVPTKGGQSTETIESSETTTVTKSRFRGGDGTGRTISSNPYSMRNGGAGGVVIEVRPSRK